MSRVVGSAIAGRMILDKLAGSIVLGTSVPTAVNPVATGKVVSRDPGECIDAHLVLLHVGISLISYRMSKL